MKTQKSRGKPNKPGKRHPLMLQQHWSEQTFWLDILIIAFTAGLLAWDPPAGAQYRPYFSVVLVGTALIMILTLLFRLRAYVQCRPNALRIQLPFHRLTIPYSSIRATRPNEFFRLYPPEDQRWTQRSFLQGLWGTTVVLVDLEHLPSARPWLRLWMSKYMLDPKEPSLTLPVRDWIALRGELDESLSRHRGNNKKP